MIGKWLVRAGSLLILLGFVLPSIATSCTAAFEPGTTYSLLDLAGWSQTDLLFSQPLLFMAPVGALVILMITFLQPQHRTKAVDNLWGEIAVLGISLLCLLIALLSLAFKAISFVPFLLPIWGFAFLTTGYMLSIVGIGLQWVEIHESERHQTRLAPKPARSVSPGRRAPPSRSGQKEEPVIVHRAGYSRARLEMLRGIVMPSRIVPIDSVDYTIGRAGENHLQLIDIAVSRRHARLRNAQELWFIQDQGSAGGTYVNGDRVRAARIKSGDVISIGNSKFVFRTQ